jgi:VRR-NUC domain.
MAAGCNAYGWVGWSGALTTGTSTPGMSEHEIQQRILIACGSGTTRLWRNNVGTGWAGPATKITAGNIRAVAAALRPGDVVVRQGRPLHAGLCVGSSDLIGYRQVGGVAQFVALEVKSATGRPTTEQTRFLDHIQAAGGVSGIVRSIDAAQALLAVP